MSSTQAGALAAPPRTIRSALLAAPGRFELTDVALPALPDDGVLVRTEGCGVCGSNLPVWEGREWFQYPLAAGAPGHEGWGIVEAVGPDAVGVEPGDRVAFLSGHAFAEYDVAGADSLVVLPDALADTPFPGEALGCAMNVFRRAGIRPGETVAIVGIGFLGALLTQLASGAGARVVAISRRAYALEVADACGAAQTVAMDDHQRIIDHVRDLTDGVMCDHVIEAVGTQWPLDLAGELTRERGRLTVAGFHQDGPRQVNMFLWNWRGIDVINAHERDPAMYVQGMRDAVAAVSSGVLQPAGLYTHRFPLDRAGDALDAMRTRPDGFLKALVMP